MSNHFEVAINRAHRSYDDGLIPPLTKNQAD